MRQKDITALGGLKQNLMPQSVPVSQLRDTTWNEIACDLGALTQIPCRAWVQFETVTSNGTYDAADVLHASIWGSGAGQKPTVTRTATGLYTVAYAASFFLGYTELEVDDESEVVSFKDAVVSCSTSDAVDNFADCRQLSVVGSTANIVVKAGGVAADVGDNSGLPILVNVRLW